MYKLIFLCFLVSCANQNLKSQQTKTKIINPKTFYQQAKFNRIERFKDKTLNDSEVYKIKVLPGDIARNGNRAEIMAQFRSENEHTYIYSWDFKISSKYLQREAKKYHLIIAQWWNGPDKGQTKEDIRGKQGPPYYLSVVNRSGKLNLQIWYGLQNLNRKKEAEIEISTDTWYHIESKVFWSTTNRGYSDININGQSFHLIGPNKYNTVSNDFKLGLYRNRDNLDTTEMYIKSINIKELEN